MPSVISHYLLAGRMSAYLQQAYPDFQINQNALYWGAQGPDFCMRIRKRKCRS